MSPIKFVALVGMLYFLLMFLGAAITQQSVECLVISFVWAGILLFLFPIFRKRGNE